MSLVKAKCDTALKQERLVKSSQKLKQAKGILSKPNQKREKSQNADVIARVTEFH